MMNGPIKEEKILSKIKWVNTSWISTNNFNLLEIKILKIFTFFIENLIFDIFFN
jgi:hypothetical protein